MPDNMKNIYGMFDRKIAADANGKDLYRFQINNENPNRNGWKTITAGLEYDEFMKTGPVVLVQHDERSIPIGKVEAITVENTIMYADIWFHEETEESRIWKKLVDLGIIQSTSIGITVLEEGQTILLTDKQKEKYPWWIDKIYVFTRSRLREVSLVNVPANTGTVLKKLIKAAFDDGALSAAEADWADIQFRKFYKENKNSNSQINKEGNTMPDTFEVRIANLENEIANKTKEFNSLKDSADELQRNNSELSAQNAKLTDELAEMKDAKAEMEKELTELRKAKEDNTKKQVEAEIDSFIAENKAKLTAKELDGELREELLHLKANEETMRFKGKSYFENKCEEVKARTSNEEKIELEIDNFIATNKEKIMPKENEDGVLKNKLLALRKAEDLKVGDKTLFEIECENITAREKGLGLTGEVAKGDTTVPAADEKDVDFSTKSYTEIFTDEKLTKKFDEHITKIASEKSLTYNDVLRDELAKLKKIDVE